MCRNITTLRGLDPPATPEEIEAAARQYVRKVTGVTRTSPATGAPFEAAVAAVAAATVAVLAALPDRRVAPSTVPPLRREEVRARIAAREAHERAHELGLPHGHGDGHAPEQGEGAGSIGPGRWIPPGQPPEPPRG